MMTDQVRTGIPSSAELPAAHLPGHRSLRQAGHVIVWLLLTGLAAAVVWVLLVVALAGGLGPHFPGPPPHPVPCPTRPRHRREADQARGRGRRALC